MLLGQCKFEAYLSFNENRYQSFSEKLDRCCNKTNNLDSVSQTIQSDIASIKGSKADRSQLLVLQNQIEELTSENLSLRTLIENLETNQAMSFQNHDQRISNNKLDTKRSNSAISDLTERVNALEIKNNHFSLFIDGIPESKELSTAEVLINRLKTHAQISLSVSDFVSIYRICKPHKGQSASD